MHQKGSSLLQAYIITECQIRSEMSSSEGKGHLDIQFIRDLSVEIQSPQIDSTMDANIPAKLHKAIEKEMLQKKNLERSGAENRGSGIDLLKSVNRMESSNFDSEPCQKFLNDALETVRYWAKRMSFISDKSEFSEVYSKLRAQKIAFPKQFNLYNIDNLVNNIWQLKDR